MFRRSFKPGLAIILLTLLANIASSAGKPYLGISLAAKIPPSVAAHLDIEGGAMIIAVIEGSPAAKAGLKEHDIIIKAAGLQVKSPADLQKALAGQEGAKNEDTLALVIRRGAKTLDFTVKPTDAPPKRAPLKTAPEKSKPAPGSKAYLGVQLERIPASLAVHLKLSGNEGVMVGKSLAGSPAYKSGLQRHDIILKVAGKSVTSSANKAGSNTIIFPDEFKDLRLGGIRGGITGGLRIESLRSLLGEDQDRVASNLTQLISAHKPGKEIEVEVIQQGDRKKIRVVLGATRKTRSLFPPTPGFPPGALRGPGSSSSSVSSVTINDGDLSITVRDTNGKKTFSVRRGDEIIAADEPWEALDKLPREIREKVRRLSPGASRQPGRSKSPKPLPPGEKKLPPGKENKKPI